jgi:hypothetical protein
MKKKPSRLDIALLILLTLLIVAMFYYDISEPAKLTINDF